MKNGVTLCWKCHGKIHYREHEYEGMFSKYVDEVSDLLDTIDGRKR